MKTLLTYFFLILLASSIYGQNVGIGNSNPDNSAALDITSSDKGILIPRMDSLAMTVITSPAKGLMVFVNDKNAFYFHNGTNWQKVNKSKALIDQDEDTYVRVDDETDNDEIDFFIKNINLATLASNNHQDFLLNIEANVLSNLMIGNNVGKKQTTGSQNLAIGNDALKDLTSGSGNIAIGSSSIQSLDTAFNNTAIGNFSLSSLKSGNSNVVIGNGAMNQGDSLFANTAIGYLSQQIGNNTSSNTSLGAISLYSNKNGKENVALGSNSLWSNQNGSFNTAIGTSALGSNGTGSGNVAIGNEAGYFESGSNKLYIENSSSASPLIYGDFANDSIKIYGSLSIGDQYSFPSSDGSSNQILSTDGTGQVSWKDNITTALKDDDLDTYVIVDDGSDDDEIAFFIKNTKRATIQSNSQQDFLLNIKATDFSNLMIGKESGSNLTSGNKNTAFGNLALEQLITGSGNVAVGNSALAKVDSSSSNTAVGDFSLYTFKKGFANTVVGAGAMTQGDTLTGNTAVGFGSQQAGHKTSSNTSMGMFSLFKNSNSSDNLALGVNSLFSNQSGDQNVAIGPYTLSSNLTGTGNIAIGYSAGASELGSNKLYIENSSSTSPLIYGDFASDLIKIYGTLGIKDQYVFPIVDGAAGHVLSTNGNGQLSWETGVLIDSNGDTYIEVNDNLNPDWIKMYVNNNNILNFKESGINEPVIETGADHLYFTNSSSSPFNVEFDFVNNEMSVEGSIGINTPTASSILHIKQVSADKGVKLESATDSDNWNTYIDNANDYNFAYNGNLKAYIQDGDGTYQVFSDRRLKKNIRTLDAILPKVLELEASKYVYKNDATEKPQIGFMAQDVEVLFPEAVNEKNGFKSINYAVFGVLAIEAIKEQQVKIDELEAKVNQILALLENKE